MRRRMIVATFLLLSCGTTSPQGERGTAPLAHNPLAAQQGSLRITCDPADARVEINGLDYGAVGSLPESGVLWLPHGVYRIEITRDDYLPFRLELRLTDQPEHIDIALDRVLQTRAPADAAP